MQPDGLVPERYGGGSGVVIPSRGETGICSDCGAELATGQGHVSDDMKLYCGECIEPRYLHWVGRVYDTPF